jgi:hypothetical protein
MSVVRVRDGEPYNQKDRFLQRKRSFFALVRQIVPKKRGQPQGCPFSFDRAGLRRQRPRLRFTDSTTREASFTAV